MADSTTTSQELAKRETLHRQQRDLEWQTMRVYFYYETLPARLAMYVNLPLSGVSWILAMMQVPPFKGLAAGWIASLWWVLSLTVIPWLGHRYEAKQFYGRWEQILADDTRW
jgi:hypothetical protein